MPRRLSLPAAALALTAGLVTPVLSPAALAGAAETPYTFAVIGDVPYGATDEAAFPAFVQRINADPDVRAVTHLGDVKSGSTECTDARLVRVRQQFDLFQGPLFYTPGDNEWTDCHRVNNGRFTPLERLATVRSLFFSPTGRTQGNDGAGIGVRSQAAQGIPENFRWTRADVSFATLHVVGSNNDLAPWDGIGETAPTPAQVAEEQHRMDVTIDNVRAAFAEARTSHRRAVVLMQQADMFDPTVAQPAFSDYSAFKPLVQAIVDESRRYAGPVYLFNGDSHVFHRDRPLAAGSSWLSFYGIDGSADRLQRVTVEGSGLGEKGYVKVSVTGRGQQPLDIRKVPTTVP
jgi:hypothetical protein